ncbi:MAG: CvpA family protein [Firmicutes bacterium]|nr:CvpA family protein [Bacillota bacterium]
MNWLSIVILAVFAFCILNGFRRGFIRTIAATVSVFVSMVFVYAVNPYVSEFIENETGIYEAIEEKCSGFIDTGMEQMEETIPENLKQVLVEQYGEAIASAAAHMIVNSLSFLLTYLIVSVVIQILVSVLDGIFKLPVLNTANRIAGGAAGFVQALFFIWIFFLIVFLLLNTKIGKQAVELIQENFFTKKLYDTNLLVHFMMSLLK